MQTLCFLHRTRPVAACVGVVPVQSYRVVRLVLQSYRHGASMFGTTAGVQCLSNKLFVLCQSMICNAKQ